MFLLDGLAHTGNRLHFIAGVVAGSVNLMPVPGPARQSRAEQLAFAFEQGAVYCLERGAVENCAAVLVRLAPGFLVTVAAGCHCIDGIFERSEGQMRRFRLQLGWDVSL